jgi:hypothetical protein
VYCTGDSSINATVLQVQHPGADFHNPCVVSSEQQSQRLVLRAPHVGAEGKQEAAARQKMFFVSFDASLHTVLSCLIPQIPTAG